MASLSYLTKVKTQNPGNINVYKKWIKDLHKEDEYKVEYQHSIRAVRILLETAESKRETPRGKGPKFLRRKDPNETESDQVEVILDTKEWTRSTQLRAKALAEGLHNHVPKQL